MSVYEGSRYQDAPVIRVRDAQDRVLPAIYPNIPSLDGLSYTTHVSGENDRYDLIAWQLWGDPELWWVIADVNPEYLYPDGIPSGTVLRIPVV
jgi:hypothetical protein